MRSFLAPIAGLVALVGISLPNLAQAEDGEWLDIEAGKSAVLETPKNATAIAITNPEVARVVPLASANKIQVQGLSVGSTDLVVQLGPRTSPIVYEITVHQDLSDLIRRVDAIVEGEPPRVYPLRDRIVVQGPVDDLDTLEQVALVASIYDPEFINLMSVRGDHQVQLEVVFAEMSRSGIREVGVNLWFSYNNQYNFGLWGPSSVETTRLLGSTPLEFNGNDGIKAPAAAPGTFNLLGELPFSQIDIGAVISLLDDYRLSSVLAQPTLVALSGQQAEFLSGGEVPVPAPAQGGNIQIQFKEYGIIMSFVPTVLAGDVIDVRVYIEVSEPDPTNSSRITGIEVPGFIARKARSHVRVDSGMTFAMAGMLQESTSFSRAQLPGLGDIPVLGALFRYLKHVRDEKELMVFITPRLVRPMGPGEVPAPPGTAEDNNPGDLGLFLLGLDRRLGSRTAKPTGNVGIER